MKHKKVTFGQFLKKLRQNQGLTLARLSQLAGLSPSYLSRIERGERNIPNALILKRLAPHLEITVPDLLIAAGYLNGKPSHDSRQNGISTHWHEIIKDPAMSEILDEIGSLTRDEKEGLITYLKVIKLRREENKK